MSKTENGHSPLCDGVTGVTSTDEVLRHAKGYGHVIRIETDVSTVEYLPYIGRAFRGTIWIKRYGDSGESHIATASGVRNMLDRYPGQVSLVRESESGFSAEECSVPDSGGDL